MGSDDNPALAAEPKTAVLVIRGWSTTLCWPQTWRRPLIRVPGGEIPDALVELLRDCLPAATICVPALPLGTLSTASPDALVQVLLKEVDALYEQTAFEQLIIVAFSAGTLLARNLYATACGATAIADGQVDPAAARPWADRVERLVLLAGITRGWSISSATPAKVRFLAPLILSVVTFWNRWLRRRPPLFITAVKRDAPFVIESRLKLDQVQRHYQQQPAGRLPHTALLLGSRDEYASPLDLGPREDFTFIEVPESNHVALLHVAPASDAKDQDQIGRVLRRRSLLRRALLDAPAALRDVTMRPAALAFPDARLLVFAKAPVPGLVKTRLIPVLGPVGAAQFAEDLLQETLARLLSACGAGAGLAADGGPVRPAATGPQTTCLAAVELWCAPDTAHPLFQALAQRYPLTLRQQRGADLGARLSAASAEALHRASSVVLIGCDCPDLDAAYLTAALRGLADHDAVLGPAADGGYVLLGLRRAAPTLFSDLPWGTDQVAALTRERMAALGWRWLELPALADVDRPEDLTPAQRQRWGR